MSSTFSGDKAPGQGRTVVAWKVFEYTGLGLFIVLAPRIMGPQLFGEFALLLSITRLLLLASGLGGLHTFGRFIPEYQSSHEKNKILSLFMQFFWLRVISGVFFGALFLFLIPFFTNSLSSTSTVLIVGAFFMGGVSSTFFQIFYGLNNLGRWLSKNSLQQILLLVFITLLGGWHDIELAIAAFTITHMLFFIVGLYWSRRYFSFKKSIVLATSTWHHLRFGITFLIVNLTLLVVWRSGEMMVAFFSNNSVEVAFYNIANSISLAVVALLTQITMMLVPSLTGLHISGEDDKKNIILGYSLKYLIVASFSYIFFIYIAADWLVDVMLGTEYQPVADILKILSLALPPLAVLRTGISVAMFHQGMKSPILLTLIALVSFGSVSYLLVPEYQAIGASIAIVCSMLISSVAAYFLFSLTQVVHFASFRQITMPGIVGLVALVLPIDSDTLQGAFGISLYIAGIFWYKAISIEEVRNIKRLL